MRVIRREKKLAPFGTTASQISELRAEYEEKILQKKENEKLQNSKRINAIKVDTKVKYDPLADRSKPSWNSDENVALNVQHHFVKINDDLGRIYSPNSPKNHDIYGVSRSRSQSPEKYMNLDEYLKMKENCSNYDEVDYEEERSDQIQDGTEKIIKKVIHFSETVSSKPFI